jgi:ATP-binding cassette subfamily B protein
LISILQNFYTLNGGSILIGAYDLRHIEIESLRRLISVVPQKVDLFAGTVIENIAVGDYEPDMKLAIEICSELGILEFIENLPSGFRNISWREWSNLIRRAEATTGNCKGIVQRSGSFDS